uniref:Uncharacterized protein n=1 Tax=Rhizophora mucronata TaxID=61149 RepID=A0A2P2J9Q1_RHIMU
MEIVVTWSSNVFPNRAFILHQPLGRYLIMDFHMMLKAPWLPLHFTLG